MTSISGIVHFCFIKKVREQRTPHTHTPFIIPIKFTNFVGHCLCHFVCEWVIVSIKKSHLSFRSCCCSNQIL